MTIWHAAELLVSTSAGAATYAPIFGEIDELERTNARASAEQGVALARVGFDASPLVERSDRNVCARSSTSAPNMTLARIVLGERGQGGLTDVLLGSVSSRVVHHADRPVLVVRTKRSS